MIGINVENSHILGACLLSKTTRSALPVIYYHVELTTDSHS